MGEKYLGQLTAKSAPATGDILVLEDSEDTKKIDYDALANAILNKLTTKTYTVAGRTNTLIAAIDALNSNMTNQIQSMERLDSRNLLTDTISPGYYYVIGATGIPTGASSNGYLRVYGRKSDLSILKVMEYRPYNSTNTYVSMKKGSESWSGWEKLPTRAEMDALNSKEAFNITASTGTWPSEITLQDTSYAYRFNNIVMVHINLKIVSTTKKNLVIGSVLPASMCPKFSVFAMGGDGVTDGICQPFTITPEGSISTWNTKTGTTYLQADATYIAKSGT